MAGRGELRARECFIDLSGHAVGRVRLSEVAMANATEVEWAMGNGAMKGLKD